ncbi:heterokaryon incompatibility protein-domain-containing protein, partial [Dactylonectria macrodidyma]
MPLFNAYRYEPLQAEDAIRLISLDPAADDTTPPSCSIIQRQHSTQNFKYHAVSYAWGKREFSRTLEIRCDGDTSYLRITHNVDALLRRLRRRKKRRYLWVDAICLDQNDETEKTQQIPVMGRIFEEATMVHIWLGHEDDMTAKIFAVFRKVSVLPEVKQQMAETIATLMRTNIRDDGSSGINFVVAFFDRSWFKRRWVIQEAALARQATVHCGSSSILLPGLIAAAHRLQSLDLSWYSVKMVANLGRTEAKLSTLEVLWHFHEADCLEPKDRVAALFGLVSESDRFALDYTLHWADLYKQVALRAFSCGDNDVRLQMLLHLFEFG